MTWGRGSNQKMTKCDMGGGREGQKTLFLEWHTFCMAPYLEPKIEQLKNQLLDRLISGSLTKNGYTPNQKNCAEKAGGIWDRNEMWLLCHNNEAKIIPLILLWGIDWTSPEPRLIHLIHVMSVRDKLDRTLLIVSQDDKIKSLI